MFNLKREKVKNNIFLTLSIISAFIFIAGVMYTIMGEDSPVKFIINESPIKLVVPPVLVFFVTFSLYRNSKKAIKENTK
ncbi:hypothetical protein D5266_04895 [bacterium c-19]|nr:hypothetical protein [bacterium c-19]